MQIKTAVVFGALCAGVAVCAPAHKSECAPLYKGELEYNADWAGGRTGHETGKVQYKDGKLVLGVDAKSGAQVVYERCGQGKHNDELGTNGRLVLEDNKCIVRDGDALRAGKCDKHAEFVYSTEMLADRLELKVDGRNWNRKKKNKELELRKENEETQTTGMDLKGRAHVEGGKCVPLYEDVVLGAWVEQPMRLALENGKVTLKKTGAKVTLEACNMGGHKGLGGRVRVGKKCLSVDKSGKEGAEVVECAEDGAGLKKQWFSLSDGGVHPIDKNGEWLYWSQKGKELRADKEPKVVLSVYSSS